MRDAPTKLERSGTDNMQLKSGQIKAVIFDMDGLMFDSETLYRNAIEEMGIRFGKKFNLKLQKRMMGRSNLDSIRVLKEAWHLTEDLEELRTMRDDAVVDMSNKQFKKMEGLDEVIKAISEIKLPKAIVTGSQLKVAKHFLRLAQLDKFEFILTGDEILRGKPDPEIYLAAVDRFKLKPEEVLVLEDSLNGVQSAKRAGCVTFAVPNEYSVDDDFSIADASFSSLKEIVPLIKTLGL